MRNRFRPPNAVDLKVATVGREYKIRFEIFREHHERGIGEIHGEIGILPQKLPASAQR